VKLIDTTSWRDFTYLSDQERMLNVRKKIEHNVVMNVKILIDQVARYGKEWVQRSKSKLRAQSARVLPSKLLTDKRG